MFKTAQKKVDAGEDNKAQPTTSAPVMLGAESQEETVDPSGCRC